VGSTEHLGLKSLPVGITNSTLSMFQMCKSTKTKATAKRSALQAMFRRWMVPSPRRTRDKCVTILVLKDCVALSAASWMLVWSVQGASSPAVCVHSYRPVCGSFIECLHHLYVHAQGSKPRCHDKQLPTEQSSSCKQLQPAILSSCWACSLLDFLSCVILCSRWWKSGGYSKSCGNSKSSGTLQQCLTGRCLCGIQLDGG
jgi:hypothetical protein